MMKRLGDLLKNGETLLHKRVMHTIFLFLLPLNTIIPGIGSIKPNEGGGKETQVAEGSKEPPIASWMNLLDHEDGLLSLKPWDEVAALKPIKGDLSFALREVVRQAWSKYFYLIFSLHLLISIAKLDQRELEKSPGKQSRKIPHP